MDETRKARMDMIDAFHKGCEIRAMEAELAQASAKLVEQQNEIDKMRGVIFTLAMIDRDMMTEHDEALLEEAIERAKELYDESRRT
jgi:hypothetical protein